MINTLYDEKSASDRQMDMSVPLLEASSWGGNVFTWWWDTVYIRYCHMMIWWNMLISKDCVAHTHSCSWRQNHKCDNLQPSMSIWHQDQSGGWIWKLFDISCFRRSTIKIHKEYKLLRFCNRGLRRLLHQSSHLQTVAMALSWISNMTRATALTNCSAVFWKCLI